MMRPVCFICKKLVNFRRYDIHNNVMLASREFGTSSYWSSEYISNQKRQESITKQKARLLYQSRKRGMLENGLLLSTFADKYLNILSPQLTHQYDKLINDPSNDWDIYYWVTGKEPVPEEFNNEIMTMLKNHVHNEHKEQRLYQPDLPSS